MKIKTLLISCFALVINWGYGQSLEPFVVATAGQHFENEDGQLSWTVGENIIPTLENNTAILTQGFHQSDYTITSIHQTAETVFSIKVFPNPVMDEIRIEGNSEYREKVLIHLTDIKGRIMGFWKSEELPFKIPSTNLTAGIYFVSIYSEENMKIFKTFKLVKN